jgi:hypothetical protein
MTQFTHDTAPTQYAEVGGTTGYDCEMDER